MIDDTHSPGRRSWVTSANQHADFPIQNLPLGVFTPRGASARGGIAIGDDIFDLAAALELGLFDGPAAEAARVASGGDTQPAVRAWARCTTCPAAPSRRDSRRRQPGPCPSRGAELAAHSSRRGLPPRAACHDRRLHRLLCRHSSRDQCRQTVPSRQSAVAELQIRADWLSRPRLVHQAVRRRGATPERPAQTRGRAGSELRALAQPRL